MGNYSNTEIPSVKEIDISTNGEFELEIPEIDLSIIQGGILKSHGRDHVKCIFITFNNNARRYEDQANNVNHAKKVKKWISGFAELLTSGSQQKTQIDNYKASLSLAKENTNAKINDSELLFNLYLSIDGYKYLFGTNNKTHWPEDNVFQNGMRSRSRSFYDPPRGTLGPKYGKKFIDALILIAGNDLKRLKNQYQEIKISFPKPSNKNQVEFFHEIGKRLFHRVGEQKISIEPFGFRDGLSQPQLFDKNGEPIKKQCSLILDKELGSYLVFRKLEQDVVGFNHKVAALAEKLNQTKENIEAQIIGRFKDGTPLTLFDSPRGKSPEDLKRIERFNNFCMESPNAIGYEDDLGGLKCPYHAHIRQTNTRNKLLIPDSRYPDPKVKRRIIRRGIPYDNPGEGVGMLFMCFQRSIASQFHIIQSDWANTIDFTSLTQEEEEEILNGEAYNHALDPLIGQQASPACTSKQKWNKGWDEKNRGVYFSFNEVVTYKGGEYFYAPNLDFLKKLKDLS